MLRSLVTGGLLAGAATGATAQVSQGTSGTQPAQPLLHRPVGRITYTFDTKQRDETVASRRDTELATVITFETPDFEGRGVEFGFDLHHAGRTGTDVQRVSLYDGFAGVRLGQKGQWRLRAGHMRLEDLGRAGALAGGLVEFQQPRRDAQATRVRAGAFTGREPLADEMGYAADVRKTGGYFTVEHGNQRRHAIGYTRVQRGPLVERSLMNLTNSVSAGSSVSLNQAAEFDVSGPANGLGAKGLAYFLANLRVTPAPRVELFGTYNRGRSIDARALTDNLRNGRALTPQSIEGLLYESRGGRLTVEVAPNVRVYAGYARDRNNREDSATGRVTLGGHAANLLGTGFDVSASNARIDRPGGAYQSRYVSIGHSLGPSVHVSGDYSTSLSVVRVVRSDGLVIETHPWMRRFSGHGSIAFNHRWSLQFTCDYERDDRARQIRVLSGLEVRL
ncbi:MAG: hypothetical protein ABL993_17270 [Vicinamibacterales bacterium]